MGSEKIRKTGTSRIPFPTGLIGEGAVRIAPILGLANILSDHGLDPEAFIRDTGIDPALFQDPENTISFADIGRLFVRTATVTGMETPGFELGRHAGLDVLGKVGELMSSAPDFGTALHALIRAFHLHDRGAAPALWGTGNRTMFGYTLYSPDIPGTNHIYDAALAITINTFRELLGTEWQPTEVRMFREPPGNNRDFMQFFDNKLRFGADHAAVVFPTADLDRPLTGSDPGAYASLSRDFEQIDLMSGGSSLSNRVRRLLRGLLASGAGFHGIDLPGVARHLDLHPRTLTRHLRAEEETFSNILEQVRYEFAQQMLRDTSLLIADIALLLGYGESASFNHAFRRWSGRTATAWRSSRDTLSK